MVDYDRFAAFQAQVSAVDPNSSPTLGYMSHYRPSPHLAHLDPPSSGASTPSPIYPPYVQPLLSNMSHHAAAAAAAAAAQSRQPTSYPSPSMSSYNYPPPQAPPQMDSYRSSPTSAHVGLPSLSLPPLRSIDPRNPTVVPNSMGSPMTPGAVMAAGYYSLPGGPQSLPPPPPQLSVTSSPHNQPLRYPLPTPDGRMMTGGRNKKEIKRRTKTGCLTCRRRRIKVGGNFFLYLLFGRSSFRLPFVFGGGNK